MENQQTASKYLITAPGFAYDTLRGVLCAGSRVSKSVHPLADVESLKSKLIAEGAVTAAAEAEQTDTEAAKPAGTEAGGSDAVSRSPQRTVKKRDYVCTRDIRTGPLMAYNLCSDTVQKELPDCEVALSEHDDELVSADEALRLWTMNTMDSMSRAKFEKDSFRVIKLFEAEYDRTFVNGKGDGSLSKVEQFVVDALSAAGAIDEFRRGDPADRECDIVDDKRGRQIEFVSLFDEKVPSRFRYRTEMNEEQALLMEYCDFGYNIVADGVINKFTRKNYTDRYSKELAIYMLGPDKEAADKVQALTEILTARTEMIRNNYTRIHIILHDPLDHETFAYCSNDRIESFPDSLCSYNIISRHHIWPVSDDWDRPAPSNVEEAIERLDPDRNYIIVKQGVFDPELRSMYWVKGKMVRNVI